ncbi:MAG: caspase family protein, partial [Actinoplanes sp.]
MTATSDDRGDAQLPDPARSRVVLVGPSRYEHLSPLDSVANNIVRLSELLLDESVWGLPADNLVALTDPRSTDDIEEALLAAGRAAEDTLIFYFAGHGLLEYPSARLFLALGAAEPEPIHRAIDYDRVRRAMLESDCLSKVVILDCCYSGNATMGDTNDLATQATVEGTYLLTACDANNLAVAPPDDEFTAFTGALVRLLADGIPQGPELLSTEDVYWRLREELQATRYPIPVQRSAEQGHHIVLARNRAVSRTAPRRTSAAPVEPVAGATWLPPAEVLVRLAELREQGDRRTAKALLTAIGSVRVAQEIVGIVDALDDSGLTADSDLVLHAAVRRPAGQVARLFDALLRLERTAALERTRVAVVDLDAEAIVAIAALLPADERDALLDAAVEARFGHSDNMVALVASLSTARTLDGVLDTLLERTAARIPAFDAAALGDVLRDAGREAAAFRVYEAAEEVLGQRGPAEVATLAAAMDRAGLHKQAHGLIALAVGRCAKVGDYKALLTALWDVGLAGATGDVLAEAARLLPDDRVLRLARVLWRSDRDAEAGDLLSRAAGHRPVASIIGFVRELVRVGRPLDLRRIVEEASHRTVDDLAELFETLMTDHVEAATTLADALFAREPRKAGAMLARFERAGRFELVRLLSERVGRASAEAILHAMTEMIRLGRRMLARTIAAAADSSLGSPLPGLDIPRQSTGQEVALPGMTEAISLVVVTSGGYTLKVERARLIIDLVVGSPTQGSALPLLFAGSSLMESMLAEHLMSEPAGVIASVLTRAATAGATGQVKAILDELARCGGDEVQWLRRLWHIAPEPAGTGGRRPDLVDHYLGYLARRRSPRQLAELLVAFGRWDAGPGGAFRLVDVLHEPAFRWIRPHLVPLLDGPGEAWLVDVLADGEPGETRDPSCVAAVAEVRRHLRSDVEQTVAVVTAEEWSAEFSLEPAEVPLWTIYL